MQTVIEFVYYRYFASGRASSHALVSGDSPRAGAHPGAPRDSDDVVPDRLAPPGGDVRFMRRGWILRYALLTSLPAAGGARAPRFGEFPQPTFRPTRLLTPRTSSPSPFFSVVQQVSQSDRARQLYTATIGYTSAALAVSEMVSKLTTDVNDFINAEPDAPIPPSLRQAVRLINTPELEECAARVTSGITRGVTTVASAAMGGDGDASTSGAGASEMVDRVLDKILNPANWGPRLRRRLRRHSPDPRDHHRHPEGALRRYRRRRLLPPASVSSTINDALETTLRLAASDRGRGVLLDACSAFVSAAVGTYLDKTADSNTFDDFFAAALAASNRDAFSDMAGRVTGEAVRTVVEVVSPGMMSPRAPDADARSRARRRDGRRRGRDDSHASPGAAPASSVAREVFPESPRDVRAADEAFGTSADTETGPPSSSSSRSSSRDSEALDTRDAASDSAAAAARFTSALVNDLTPHAFRAMTSADGRQLSAEVAGTCTASATRSLVLAIRDCVFFVETRDPKNGARGVYAATGIAAFRAAISVVFIVWLMASAYASLCAAGRRRRDWRARSRAAKGRRRRRGR